MGAEQFFHTANGSTPQKAFRAAVEEAAYDHGHAGYTGTIAEKNSFVEIPLPEGKKPLDYAEELLEESDDRIDDKWGPAGCIRVKDGVYLFFGWASS